MTALLTCPSCENKFRVYVEGTALKEAIEEKITIEHYNSGAFDFKCHRGIVVLPSARFFDAFAFVSKIKPFCSTIILGEHDKRSREIIGKYFFI